MYDSDKTSGIAYVTVNEDGSQPEWQPCENLVADIKNGDLMEIIDCWDGVTHDTTTTTNDEDVSNIEAIQEEVKVDNDKNSKKKNPLRMKLLMMIMMMRRRKLVKKKVVQKWMSRS